MVSQDLLCGHDSSHMALFDEPKSARSPALLAYICPPSSALSFTSNAAGFRYTSVLPLSSKRNLTFDKGPLSSSKQSVVGSSTLEQDQVSPGDSENANRGRPNDPTRHARHTSISSMQRFSDLAVSPPYHQPPSSSQQDAVSVRSQPAMGSANGGLSAKRNSRSSIPRGLTIPSYVDSRTFKKRHAKKDTALTGSSGSASDRIGRRSSANDITSTGDPTAAAVFTKSAGVSLSDISITNHQSPDAHALDYSSSSSLRHIRGGGFGGSAVAAMKQAFVIRDHRAARMLIELVRITDPVHLIAHHEFFMFLLLLCETEPQNKRLLGECGLMDTLVDAILRRIYSVAMAAPSFPLLAARSVLPMDWSMLIPYKRLISSLAVYDCPAEMAKLLWELCLNPYRVFSQLTMDEPPTSPTNLPSPGAHQPTGHPASHITVQDTQMQLLDVLNRVAKRAEPSDYFVFDGMDGVFESSGLDRFPSTKTGYTLSMWIRLGRMTGGEVGFLCFEDPSCYAPSSTGCNQFELYFRELSTNRLLVRRASTASSSSTTGAASSVSAATERPSTRYCLCLHIHSHSSPPEDFVFDAYDFSHASSRKSTGQFVHVVFSHGRHGISLMVDGRLIQTFQTQSFPRSAGIGRDSALRLVIGRRAMVANDVTATTRAPSSTIRPSSSTGWFSGFWGSSSTATVATTPASAPSAATTTTTAVRTYSLPKSGFLSGTMSSVIMTSSVWTAEEANRVYRLGAHSFSNVRHNLGLDAQARVLQMEKELEAARNRLVGLRKGRYGEGGSGQ
jgi:hypothetical protein